MNESGKKLISGVRTLDNCYGLVPDADIVCNSIRLPNEDLWHQRMGHASYKHLSIVSKHELVLGIAKLSRMGNVVCGPCQLKFKLYQMDVKTAFLNEILKEDVYMAQPKAFIDPHFSDHVLYLKKALYELTQAPRVWSDRLTQYLEIGRAHV